VPLIKPSGVSDARYRRSITLRRAHIVSGVRQKPFRNAPIGAAFHDMFQSEHSVAAWEIPLAGTKQMHPAGGYAGPRRKRNIAREQQLPIKCCGKRLRWQPVRPANT
jgi:hypothetical protein